MHLLYQTFYMAPFAAVAQVIIFLVLPSNFLPQYFTTSLILHNIFFFLTRQKKRIKVRKILKVQFFSKTFTPLHPPLSNPLFLYISKAKKEPELTIYIYIWERVGKDRLKALKGLNNFLFSLVGKKTKINLKTNVNTCENKRNQRN